jgi:DNA-binding LytR/AlgR family response regulator
MKTAKSSLCFISSGRVLNILFASITHISKHGADSIIYTEDNIYQTHLSLQQLLMELPGGVFFRIHRSHIISLKHMKGIQRKKIKVGVQSIPVSAYYKQQMIKVISNMLDEYFEFHFPYQPLSDETLF